MISRLFKWCSARGNVSGVPNSSLSIARPCLVCHPSKAMVRRRLGAQGLCLWQIGRIIEAPLDLMHYRQVWPRTLQHLFTSLLFWKLNQLECHVSRSCCFSAFFSTNVIIFSRLYMNQFPKIHLHSSSSLKRNSAEFSLSPFSMIKNCATRSSIFSIDFSQVCPTHWYISWSW